MTPLDVKEGQLALPLDVAWREELEEIVGAHEQAHNPKFTGMKLYKGDPERYRRIVFLRQNAGMTVREVAAVERCSPQSVTAVMKMEEAGKTAEQYRDEAQTELAVLANLTREALKEALLDPERVAGASLRDLAYLMKEVHEKKELLSGGATHRGEVVDREAEKQQEALRHAKQAEELLASDGLVIEAEVVEGACERATQD